MRVLKIFTIISLTLFLSVSCNRAEEGESAPALILYVDKSEIYKKGEEVVTFSLTYEGAPVTDGYTIYLHEADGTDVPIEGNTYTPMESRGYCFWAEYNGVRTETYTCVYVVPDPPAAPVDNNPEKTNFTRRVLLTQFTGTGCQYCPYMVNALYEVDNYKDSETKEYLYRDKIAIAAAHIGPFAGSDPALLVDDSSLDDAFGINSYPSLVVDLIKGSNGSIDPSYSSIKKAVDNALERTAVKGGIAVNAVYDRGVNYVVINTLVKAAESAKFRVGAWLLEDGIYGKQTKNSGIPTYEQIDYNTHNNCIRSANSKYSNLNFAGLELGTIDAGKTASKTFSFKIKSNWNVNKLRLLVFISTEESRNVWYVNNVVKAPINGFVDFEYTAE